MGLARIADDVSPELARATIESVSVLGAFHASAEVRRALANGFRDGAYFATTLTSSSKSALPSPEFSEEPFWHIAGARAAATQRQRRAAQEPACGYSCSVTQTRHQMDI